jgi:hypothetical protein
MALLIGVAMGVITAQGIDVVAGNIFIDLFIAALTGTILLSRNKLTRFIAIAPFLYIVFSQLSKPFLLDLFGPAIIQGMSPDYGIYGWTLFFAFFMAKRYQLLILNHQNRERPQWAVFQESVVLNSPNQPSIFALIAINLIWYGIALSTANTALTFMSIQSYAILSMLPLLFYSGNKGNTPRWFEKFAYAYYPFHFVVLYGLYLLITMPF